MGHYSRRDYLRAIPAATIGLTAGCLGRWIGEEDHPVTESVESWPMFRGDPMNTAYARGQPDIEDEADEKWTFETDGPIWGSPTVDNGLVYLGSTDGKVYALDVETGDEEWRFQAGVRVESTPACWNDLVVVGSFDRHVYALDARTGELQWEFETDGLVRSSPTVVDGAVYIGSGCLSMACGKYAEEIPRKGWIYSIDASEGTENWVVEVENEVLSSPAVSDGTLYIGVSDGQLYAIDAHDGDIEWTFEADGDIWSSPAVAFGSVYFADWTATVYAVDADSSREEWSSDTGGQYISSSPAVDEETVYIGHTRVAFGDEDDLEYGSLLAFDRETGERRWVFETGAEEVGSSPVVTDGCVYVGAHGPPQGEYFPPELPEHGVHAVSVTGEPRWYFRVPGRGVGSSPLIHDGTLIFGGEDNVVYAIH